MNQTITKEDAQKIVDCFVDILKDADTKLDAKHVELTEPYASYTQVSDGSVLRAFTLNDLPPEEFKAIDAAGQAVQDAQFNIQMLTLKWNAGLVQDEDMIRAAQTEYREAMEAVDAALVS